MRSDDAVLEQYLADVRQYAVLTADEERALAQRIKNGRQASDALRTAQESDDRARLEQAVADGRAARDEFVARNQRLVVYVAKRFVHRGLALMDLIQEANLGLLTAVDQFDGDRGVRFSTFAIYWIRHAVRRGCMQRGRAIALPIHVAEAAQHLERRREELAETCGREPTDGELAAALGLSLERFRALAQVSEPPCSLDAPATTHASEPVIDALPDTAPLPDEQALRAIEGETLRAMIAGMELPQRSVLALRFGLSDGQPRSRQATATLLNLSRAAVARCETSGLASLRAQRWRFEDAPRRSFGDDVAATERVERTAT